jgi:hypothetical protein
MEAFLDLAARGSLSHAELRGALTMLPLAMADNPSEQLLMMERRRGEVQRMGSATSRSYREEALAAIDEFITEIKRSMAERPASIER